MIKRKDLLKTAFATDTVAVTGSTTDHRVPSGAVRAMGLSLGRIGEDAAKAEALEQQLARGELGRTLPASFAQPGNG